MIFNIFDERILKNCIAYLQNEGLGKEVKFGPIRKSRQQESYWHVCLKVVSDYTGEDLETTKLRIKYTVLPLQELKTSNGKTYLHPISTVSLSKQDYSKLVDATLMLGAQLGLTMPSGATFGLDQ